MSWAKNLQVRNNLALTIAGAALVAAFLMLALGRSAGRYEPQLGETVNYPQLIAEYSEVGYNTIFTVFILLSFTFGASLIITPRGKGLPAIGLMLIASMLACFVCTMNTFGNRTVLTHQQTIEFRSHVYHLTFETDYEDDYTVPNLLLFECEVSGVACVPVYSQYRYPENREAGFLMDNANNALHLQFGDETVYTVH